MLQIVSRLRMIGNQSQCVQEIFAGFGYFACPRFQHSQIIPVISVVLSQAKGCFLFRNRLLKLPCAG